MSTLPPRKRQFDSVILAAVGGRRQMDGDVIPRDFYDDAVKQDHAALAQTQPRR